MLLAHLKCLRLRYSSKIKEAAMAFQNNKVKDPGNQRMNLINKIRTWILLIVKGERIN